MPDHRFEVRLVEHLKRLLQRLPRFAALVDEPAIERAEPVGGEGQVRNEPRVDVHQPADGGVDGGGAGADDDEAH